MNDIKVFLSEEEIKNKVAQLGKQISEDYRGEDKNLILIGTIFFCLKWLIYTVL